MVNSGTLLLCCRRLCPAQGNNPPKRYLSMSCNPYMDTSLHTMCSADCAGFQSALLATVKRGSSQPVVVNVNSFGGRIPLRNMSAYSASKFALAGGALSWSASSRASQLWPFCRVMPLQLHGVCWNATDVRPWCGLLQASRTPSGQSLLTWASMWPRSIQVR